MSLPPSSPYTRNLANNNDNRRSCAHYSLAILLPLITCIISRSQTHVPVPLASIFGKQSDIVSANGHNEEQNEEEKVDSER